jgi:hypothetical protein
MTDFVWIYEMRPHICMKLTTSTVLSHTNELPRNIASMPTKSQKKRTGDASRGGRGVVDGGVGVEKEAERL